MKKTIKIMLVSIVAFVCMGAMSISNGATESEIIEYMLKPLEINGKTVNVPEKYIKEAKRYIQMYGVSETEGDELLKKLDEVYNLFKTARATDFDDLTKAEKKQFLKISQDAAAVVGAKITYTTDYLTIFGKDGKKFVTFHSDEFVQTGNNYMLYIALGVAIIAVASVVLYRKKA